MEALNAAGRVILLAEASALYEPYLDRRDDFGADVLALLDQGRLIPATDYVNAQRLRKMLLHEFRALFRTIDCLFTPTTPIVAPRIGQRQVELDGADAGHPRGDHAPHPGNECTRLPCAFDALRPFPGRPADRTANDRAAV